MTDQRERIDAWWRGLDMQQRAEVMQHLHEALPTSIAKGMAAAGILFAGAKWEDHGGYTFMMPPDVIDYIESQRDRRD
jgi:hypothetical protein